MLPTVVVHGGASFFSEARIGGAREGVKAAARAAYLVLQGGGLAVKAVEAAVTCLENNPVFNSGTGSAINLNGDVEMDAMIMDGRDLKSGAVASVQNIKNPIQLANRVMTQTDHCLLVGAGANQFAAAQGVPSVSLEELTTASARQELEEMQKYGNTIQKVFYLRENRHSSQPEHDTVGAVVLDCQGNLACGTSTGGITAQQPGRVGDSPLVGSGGYADNQTGAVATTGHGEAILKICLSHRIIMEMEKGSTGQQAADTCLELMAERVGGSGGAIVLSKSGDVGHAFTTAHMPWAHVSQGQVHYGMLPGEHLTEHLQAS